MSENESENTNVFSEFLYDIGDFFSGNDRKQEKQLQADLRAAQAADLEFHKMSWKYLKDRQMRIAADFLL